MNKTRLADSHGGGCGVVTARVKRRRYGLETILGRNVRRREQPPNQCLYSMVTLLRHMIGRLVGNSLAIDLMR
jgi:hypothetical protein